MSAWLFIFTWYNLPFTFLLGICVVLAGLQLIGLGGPQEGSADLEHGVDLEHSIDVEHSVDVEHDVELDHDMDLGHDLDHDAGDFDHDLDHDAGDLDHEIDHAVEHEAGHDVGSGSGFSFLSILAFLGVGKAPVMVVLLILFGSIGILGWTINLIVVSLLGGYYPGLAFVGVLLVVLFLGVTVSSRTAQFIAKALPPFVSTASRAEALVGRIGTVISPTVDETYGQVHMRDPGGTLITVFAVTRAEAPILRGEEVVMASYDAQLKRYIVTRSKQVAVSQLSSR